MSVSILRLKSGEFLVLFLLQRAKLKWGFKETSPFLGVRGRLNGLCTLRGRREPQEKSA
jgi:hypothetical protein